MVIGNLCRVCGYAMEEPPSDYNICPSCGTEYGVHDVNSSLLDLRKAWVGTGPRWWSTVDPEPANWNPFIQLANLSNQRAAGSAVFVISGSDRI